MVTRAARLSWPIARRKPGRLRPSCIHARPNAPTRYASATSFAAGRGALVTGQVPGQRLGFGNIFQAPAAVIAQYVAHRQSRGAVSPRSPVCRKGSTPWMKVDSSIARAPWPCHSGGSSRPAGLRRPAHQGAPSVRPVSAPRPSAPRCRAARSAAGGGVAVPVRRCPRRYRRHPARPPARAGSHFACPTVGQRTGRVGQSFGVVAVHGRSGRLRRRGVD